jgi:hypothetical protein
MYGKPKRATPSDFDLDLPSSSSPFIIFFFLRRFRGVDGDEVE